MNKEILLTYTEFPKDHVEYVFYIHTAKQPSQRNRRPSQFLRREFLAIFDH